MNKDIARWPEELPLPVKLEVEEHVNFTPDSIKIEEDINQLVHEIYWYPDKSYYLFTKVNEGFGDFFAPKFKPSGFITKTNERCFYIHPATIQKQRLYIHLPPDELEYDWHREAAKTQEYTRFTIELAPWKRKELDMLYTAKATVSIAEENTPVLEAKPGIMGFSINIFAISNKIKRWWRDMKV